MQNLFQHHTPRRALSALALAASVAAMAAVCAGSASAQPASNLTHSRYASGCPAYTTTRPFLPWLDLGSYYLAPRGDFESTLTGWTVSGAKIVAGNEPYYVTSPTDSHSLYLPAGASATTPSLCVSLDSPDLRLFVKNTGSLLGTLTINMSYTDALGRPAKLTVAKLVSGSSWNLSLPVLFLANVTSILNSNGQTWVSFQLVSSGNFYVDDFYVDPIKHQ